MAGAGLTAVPVISIPKKEGQGGDVLELTDLSAGTAEKTIVEHINLAVRPGEVVVLFGPNGSGKSTLIKTIMGIGGFRIKSGSIRFKGQDIGALPTDARVRLGLGLMYQNPPKVRGVTLRQVARFLSRDEGRIDELAAKLLLKGYLDRELNVTLSGGEVKRAELFQLLLQSPDLALLDEPESGVDLENIAVMGEALHTFLALPGKSAFIITHTGYILDYLDASRGCVMMNGKFWCFRNARDIFTTIRAVGYERCLNCDERQPVEK